MAGAALAVAWMAYRHTAIRPAARLALIALRFATLLLLVVFLMRPVARSTEADARDAVVAILVDTSRSMSIQDVSGERRIDRARSLVTGELLPALGSRFQTELLAYRRRSRANGPARPERRWTPERPGRRPDCRARPSQGTSYRRHRACFRRW